MLDGMPIVGVLTGYKQRSQNAKTGKMLQTWIIRSDVHPSVAAKNGMDYSICGNCPHRADAGTGRKRSCYVNVAYAPAAVYRAYKAGAYRTLEEWPIQDRPGGHAIRMGSYGDPACIPESAWTPLRIDNRRKTGYTHQWKNPIGQWLKQYCMASVDSVAEYIEATDLGWKCFMVHNHNDLRTRKLLQLHGARPCPSSKEWVASGKKQVPCETCLACNGSRHSVVIAGHGSARNRIGLVMV